MARQGGYNSFSFREIAKAVGVKSASVHYHFATKEALGAAIAKNYTAQFLGALGDPDALKTAKSALSRYISAYRQALVEDGMMCLCGVLGAEIDALPPAVTAEARHFFVANIDWLMTAIDRPDGPKTKAKRREKALKTIATLEGAMILSRTLGDHSVFDQAVKSLTATPSS